MARMPLCAKTRKGMATGYIFFVCMCFHMNVSGEQGASKAPTVQNVIQRMSFCCPM